jgi:hypothetical protein
LGDEEEEEAEDEDGDYVILRLRRDGQEEKFRIDKVWPLSLACLRPLVMLSSAIKLTHQDTQQDKQFQKLHDSYCQKKRLIPAKYLASRVVYPSVCAVPNAVLLCHVASTRVKFIFDGLPVNMQSTPEGEDMEDDDLVDVKVEPGAQLPAAAPAAATTSSRSTSVPIPQPEPEPAPYVDDDDDSEFVVLRVRRGTEEDKFRIRTVTPTDQLTMLSNGGLMFCARVSVLPLRRAIHSRSCRRPTARRRAST